MWSMDFKEIVEAESGYHERSVIQEHIHAISSSQIQDSVTELVNSLYQKDLINQYLRHNVETTKGFSGYDQVSKIVDCVGKCLIGDDLRIKEMFDKFCAVVEELGSSVIAKSMRSRHAELLRVTDDSHPEVIKTALKREISEQPCSESSDTRSPSWELFRRYYDRLVEAIDDSQLCLKLIELMLDRRLIGATEAQSSKYLVVPMCPRSILATFDTKLLRGREPEAHLDQFLHDVLSKLVALRPSMSNLLKEMEQEAIEAVGVDTLSQTEVPERNTRGKLRSSTQTLPSYVSDPAVEKYASYLRKLYEIQKADSLWQDGPHQEYINLNIVLKDDIPASDDDTVVTLKDIERDSCVGSRLLIEGAPGVGKSTLAHRFCKLWREKELFAGYPLLVYIRLRKQSKPIKHLRDFFFHRDENLKERVYQAISQNEGEGVLFILDSYDELRTKPKEVINDYNELINGLIFPGACIIVLTRHSDTKVLRKLNLHFSRSFEVLGFNEAGIDEYLSQYSFRSELNDVSHLRSCYPIPLYLAIIVKLFQSRRRHCKKTLTDIYNFLIVSLLKRHLDSQETESLSFDSITNLPPSLCGKFLKLCKLAYEITFSHETGKVATPTAQDIKLFDKHQIYELVDDFIGKTDDEDYNKERIHFTIQEFLAAIYVSKFSLQDQQDIYSQYFRECPESCCYATVFSFVAGLTQLKSIHLQLPDQISNFNFFQQLYESQNVALIRQVLVGSIHVRRIWPPRITIQDFFVLGYCIGLSQCKWQLGFTFRTVTSEHLVMLKKGILESFSKDSAGKITVIKFSLNEITDCGLDELMLVATKTNLLDDLKSLNLRGTKLSSCASLPKHFRKFPSLQELVFHENSIQFGGHKDLISVLSYASHLVYVSFSHLSPEECRLLLISTKIKKIELWQIIDESISALIESLCDAQSIEELTLFESVTNCQNLKELPHSLQLNVSLEALKLFNCNVSCETCRYIMQAVLKSKSISILNLENNLIKDEGGGYLADMLSHKEARPLKELNICRNPLGEESVARMRAAVEGRTDFELILPSKWG